MHQSLTPRIVQLYGLKVLRPRYLSPSGGRGCYTPLAEWNHDIGDGHGHREEDGSGEADGWSVGGGLVGRRGPVDLFGRRVSGPAWPGLWTCCRRWWPSSTLTV